jgi:transcription regulator MmyB-like protein
LARALRLDPDHHRHLRRLAGLPIPEPIAKPVVVDGRLQRLVDTATPAPAVLYDRHYDYIAWNNADASVRHNPDDLSNDRRNMVWWMLQTPR